MTAAAKTDHVLQAAVWRQRIEAVDTIGDADLTRLKALSLRFIGGEWFRVAIEQGWGALEMFGIFPAALTIAVRRLDATGLVPMLTLGVHGGRLIEISAEAAIIEGRDGNRHRHPRQLAGAPWSLPWWEFYNPEGNDDA